MKRPTGVNGVGRISIDLEVANYSDIALSQRGVLPKDKVRRQTVRAIVDSGATKLVLPEKVVKALGLPPGDKITVRYADGRTAQRRTAEASYVSLLGRHGTFTAVVEPKRETALLGAIVLEDLDLIVDCPNERVVPRDPKREIHEIE